MERALLRLSRFVSHPSSSTLGCTRSARLSDVTCLGCFLVPPHPLVLAAKRWSSTQPPPKRIQRRNEEITASRLLVISSKGENMGVLTREEALSSYDRKKFDLVEVNPNAQTPVCRVVDRKEEYDRKKAGKANKRLQRPVKEVEMRTVIDPHDFQIKVDRAREFLAKGHQVRFIIVYKKGGRTAQDLLKDVVTFLKGEAVMVGPATLARTLTALFAAKKEQVKVEAQRAVDDKGKDTRKAAAKAKGSRGVADSKREGKLKAADDENDDGVEPDEDLETEEPRDTKTQT